MDNICLSFEHLNLKLPSLYPMLLDDLESIKKQLLANNKFYSLELNPVYDLSENNIIELINFIHNHSNCKLISSDMNISLNLSQTLIGIYIDLFIYANSFV